MSWTQMESNSRSSVAVPEDKAKDYEKTKNETLSLVQKESEEVKPFKQVEFQPVRSPGLYEAEFGLKGDDLIFHFWPWNYHTTEKSGGRLPPFPRGFETYLAQVMSETFGARRVEAGEDPDMGAFFVKAIGFSANQFHRELAIQACEKLHKVLGGE